MLFKRKTTWVLVADGARARIFEKGNDSLQNATGEDYCSENLRNQDIVSDKPGRSFESATPMRHAYEPRTDWHDYQKELFAKELCNIVKKSTNEFDELVLISSPKTLGDLRSNMCKQVKAKIRAEIPKDVTKLTERELVAYLDKEL